jgi:HK97 family phage major capsid protein
MSVVVTTFVPGIEGAQVTNKNNTAIDLLDLHDMVGQALGAYAEVENMRWFMTPRLWTYIRKIRDSYGRFQLQPSPALETEFQLLGRPVSQTNHMALNAPTTGASSIALIDMGQVAVARDLEPSVRVLDQLRGDRDQTVIRVVARYDIAPRNAKGVVIYNNVVNA